MAQDYCSFHTVSKNMFVKDYSNNKMNIDFAQVKFQVKEAIRNVAQITFLYYLIHLNCIDKHLKRILFTYKSCFSYFRMQAELAQLWQYLSKARHGQWDI